MPTINIVARTSRDVVVTSPPSSSFLDPFAGTSNGPLWYEKPWVLPVAYLMSLYSIISMVYFVSQGYAGNLNWMLIWRSDSRFPLEFAPEDDQSIYEYDIEEVADMEDVREEVEPIAAIRPMPRERIVHPRYIFRREEVSDAMLSHQQHQIDAARDLQASSRRMSSRNTIYAGVDGVHARQRAPRARSLEALPSQRRGRSNTDPLNALQERMQMAGYF